MPGYMNPVPGGGLGLGFRRGGGGGRGRRNWYYATGLPGWTRAQYGLPAWGMGPGGYAPVAHGPYATAPVPYPFGPVGSPGPEDELNFLKGQAEYLEDELEGIKKRIAQLGTAKQKGK